MLFWFVFLDKKVLHTAQQNCTQFQNAGLMGVKKVKNLYQCRAKSFQLYSGKVITTNLEVFICGQSSINCSEMHNVLFWLFYLSNFNFGMKKMPSLSYGLGVLGWGHLANVTSATHPPITAQQHLFEVQIGAMPSSVFFLSGPCLCFRAIFFLTEETRLTCWKSAATILSSIAEKKRSFCSSISRVSLPVSESLLSCNKGLRWVSQKVMHGEQSNNFLGAPQDQDFSYLSGTRWCTDFQQRWNNLFCSDSIFSMGTGHLENNFSDLLLSHRTFGDVNNCQGFNFVGDPLI